MVHDNVMEVPEPDPARSGETLEQCTKQLSSSERNYYHRRAAQEAAAAQDACCIEARLAHEHLAEAYRLLCRSRNSGADPRLASESSTFLFGSRPPE